MKKARNSVLQGLSRRIVKHGKMDSGWTFIETLVVIAIVLILTGTVGFVAFRSVDQARQVSARSQIESFSLALTNYFIDSGTYPSADQHLAALWSEPSGSPPARNWRGPYIDKAPASDPWGNAWEYNSPAPNGLPFEIISRGADGLPGGEGNNADIVSWEN